MIKQFRRQDGFTLIEVIVVAGIIAILAGILVPLIFKEIDESKISRATADIRSISNALLILRKDTGQWPVSENCEPHITMISSYSDAPIPKVPDWVGGWDMSAVASFNDYLMSDDYACWGDKWKGPYMAQAGLDPWGNAYVVNASKFSVANSPVWILSAGPNGQIDTPADSKFIKDGDIGMRLK